MKRAFSGAIATALVCTALAVAPVAAGDGLRATLDGKPLRFDRVAQFHCHTFDYPVIRCFSSGDQVTADVARQVKSSAALLLSGYVTAYADYNYSGSSISMAQDISSLGSIGWNDRISSFKSFGASGGFWEHTPPGGFYYGYAATSQISDVGAAYNDKFSAFDIS